MQCSVAPHQKKKKKCLRPFLASEGVCETTDNAEDDLGVRAFAQLSLRSGLAELKLHQ